MSFSFKATKYFCNLKIPSSDYPGVNFINPYSDDDVRYVVKQFYSKFYKDNKERLFVIGINPGRFGGGLTGLAFTDPVALREYCGIENNLGNKKELSSKFIYSVIDKFGGAEKFFSKVFLTALYPLAIIRDRKNYNYYEDRKLAEHVRGEILQNIKSQISFGTRRDYVIVLGKKNTEYFLPINEEYKFFDKIITLEHPRYIMQYKLKQKNFYINKYLNTINN